ncbi:Importin subunit alpha-like protein [Fragilaria crotonensis]|nr:Importin subunit alpha-like protein [Fragilaria crotonensis]
MRVSSTIQQSKRKGPEQARPQDLLTLSPILRLPQQKLMQHSPIVSKFLLPPPTPVSSQEHGSTSFPQQLSASSQHLLLRHADAIPTLISLLSSPNREVYEQAMDSWKHCFWRLKRTSSNVATSSSSDGGRDKSVAARDWLLQETRRRRVGGLVPRLVELLGHSSWRVTKPALRTIGNIVCAECSDDNIQSAAATTDYTEVILDCSAVPKLRELVTHSNREIQKEACWTLSNIAAGTVDQIQAVIDSGAIPPLVKLVSNKGTDQELKKQGEMARREASDGDDGEATPTLVSASLIEKALDKHNSSAVTKRAGRIWKQHFVSCALCHKSFSKHRTTVATFCEECKCYVCSSCDCQIYHLSYQEELWAATEEQTEAKKNAKKSKKAKKKEKQKQKRASQPHQVHFADTLESSPNSRDKKGGGTVRSRSSTVNSLDDSVGESNLAVMTSTGHRLNTVPIAFEGEGLKSSGGPSPTSSDVDDDDRYAQEEDDDPEEEVQAPIDFVLYLQQTGSMIALAKLMDALDYNEGHDLSDAPPHCAQLAMQQIDSRMMTLNHD